MNYRQVGILRDLILAEDFITSGFLAQKYSVSTKTIYLDLSFLNREVKALAVNKIEKIPRRGVRLVVSDNEKQQLVDFLNDLHAMDTTTIKEIPREYLLLKKLFFSQKGEIDILDWSVNYFVSETSVRRDIEKLESHFKDYNFKLERHNGKCRIVGKEKEIRKFLRNYLVTEFHPNLSTIADDSLFTYFFSKKKIKEVSAILHHYAAFYQFIIGEQYRIYLIIDLLIATMRYGIHHVITSDERDPFDGDLSSYEVYTFAGDLLRESLNQKASQLPSVEITNLSYSLLSVGYEMNGSIIGNTINTVVANLIKRVGRLLSIDLSQDEHLLKMLVSHIQPMIFRLKNKILINSDITEEIKGKYSVLYNMVWLSCRQLSEVFSIEITDDEVVFLTVHFEIALEKLAKPLMIYVVCPQGLATTELIMTSLSRVISNFDYLVKIDSKDLTPDKVKQADMIISSISLPESEDYSKFVFISPILTDADLNLLQNRYSQLLKGNRRMLSVIEDKEAYIKTLIQKLIGDNIFLGINKRTVEGCIDFLVEKSAAQNRKNKQYQTSILDRERLGSTSVYTGIALPHAEPAAVKESQLIMMTLKKPIRWGSNMVKVIMLISMSEKDESHYKDALISIYSKIDSSDYIDKLWSTRTPAEFLEVLQEINQ